MMKLKIAMILGMSVFGTNCEANVHSKSQNNTIPKNSRSNAIPPPMNLDFIQINKIHDNPWFDLELREGKFAYSTYGIPGTIAVDRTHLTFHENFDGIAKTRFYVRQEVQISENDAKKSKRNELEAEITVTQKFRWSMKNDLVMAVLDKATIELTSHTLDRDNTSSFAKSLALQTSADRNKVLKHVKAKALEVLYEFKYFSDQIYIISEGSKNRVLTQEEIGKRVLGN